MINLLAQTSGENTEFWTLTYFFGMSVTQVGGKQDK